MQITKELLLSLQAKVQVTKITQLKKIVNTTSNHYDFLYELAKEIKPKLMVELGTHFGVATAYMNAGCPEAQIFTIDNDLIKSTMVGKLCSHLPNVRFILADAKQIADKLPNDIDFIFIDEEKEPEDLQANLELYYPKVKSGGALFFDDVLSEDIYAQSYKWWKELTGYNKMELPDVHVGYAWGVVLKP